MRIRISGGTALAASLVWIFLSSCNHHPETRASGRYAPKTFRVNISGMKFEPATLTLHRGDTVEWFNQDMVVHDVTQVPNSSWTSSTLPPGKSWKTAVEDGTNYFCSIHVVMVGKLIVE